MSTQIIRGRPICCEGGTIWKEFENYFGNPLQALADVHIILDLIIRFNYKWLYI
jgi:hypothetical protein